MYDFDHLDRDFLTTRAVMKWENPDPEVIPLSLADIDFRPPDFIRSELHKAVDADYSPYGPYYGRTEVLEAIQEKLIARNHISPSLEDIMIVPGTMFAIYIVCQALLNEGDEVIICPSPVYAPLYLNAQKAGARILHCPWSFEDTDHDIRSLEKLITSRTRLIMICNPHNPTGRILDKHSLGRISELALKRGIMLFSDELYEDMCYDTSFISLGALSPLVRESSVTVFGASKAFGVPGYRVAYLTGGKSLMRRIKALSPTMIVHTDSLAQSVLLATLTHGKQWLIELRDHLIKAGDLLVNGLNEIPGFSCDPVQATPFVFPDIRATGYSSDTLKQILQDELKIITQSGTYFGPLGEGYIRLNFATSCTVLEEVLSRLHKRFT